MRSKALLLLPAAALLFAGCPEKSSGTDKKDEEHTLLKLKEAQQQKGAGQGAPHADDDARDKLANLAAAGKTDEGGPRPLPVDNQTVHLGTVALKLVGLQTSPLVAGGKLTLSTDQTFLLVKLYAQNVGDKPVKLDLSSATVTSKTGELPIARDAQHVAGTKDLAIDFGAGAEKERSDLILIFEVPPSDLGQGLVLNLSSPAAGQVKIPLE